VVHGGQWGASGEWDLCEYGLQNESHSVHLLA
jgi:hypothetical protein